MSSARNMILLLGALCAMALVGCGSMEIAGDTSQTGNTYIVGSVLDTNDMPARNAEVMAIPADYNPLADNAPSGSSRDTTSPDGRYSISVRQGISYNIAAVSLAGRTRFLRKGIAAFSDTILAPTDTLRQPGRINVRLPGGTDATHGYVYVPGTTNYSLLSPGDSFAVLDSVPAGVSLSVYYNVKGAPAQQPKVLQNSVVVAPGSVLNIEYVGWNFSKKLVLNTTASGGNVAGMVTNFPLLVRLSPANFNFAEAESGGEDVRFAKSDGTPLPYEIERWDAAANAAEIWVKVDTVFGNDSSHLITMYWGTSTVGSTGSPQGSATPSLSNGAAVFDTANGFQGVWHLDEASGFIAKDATGNHFDGTKLGSTLPSAASGAIGAAQEFDGSSSFIQMLGTAGSKLNFPENGNYSLSAWVYVDTLVDSTTHVIASKGHEQYFLKLYWDGPHWEFTEFHDNVGWQVSSYSPAQARAWKYLVGVRDGINQYLYLDGELVTSDYGIAANATARNTSDDFSIGKYLRSAGYPGEGFSWFDGTIDEVRVSSKSLGADWIKLCYMNQKEPDALVKW